MTDQTTAQTGTGDDAVVDKTAATIAEGADKGTGDGKVADKAADAGATADKSVSWPDDWRDRLAGEDAALRKRLDRFASPNDLSKSFRELEKKLSSGEKNKLPENPTPEQLAQWRKDNGVPENPDAYVAKLALPDGVVLGEADKPVAAAFAEFAHTKNWDAQKFNEAIEWYYDHQDRQRAAQHDADATFHQESVAALKTEWEGADFRRNTTAVKNMLASWPVDLRDGVLAARTPDGRKLGDHPAFVKQLAALALELNPAATLIPGTPGNPTKGVDDRIKELESWMGSPSGSDNWKKYWKDDSVQSEYRELIDARDKLKSRAA